MIDRAKILSAARKSNFHWQCMRAQDLEEELISTYKLPGPISQLNEEQRQQLYDQLAAKCKWVNNNVYKKLPYNSPGLTLSPGKEHESLHQ